MDDQDTRTPGDSLVDHLEAGENDAALACAEDVAARSADERKAAARSLRTFVEEGGTVPEAVLDPFAALLDGGERPVRLATAKLIAAVAERDPDAVAPLVPDLAARLADPEEFYFVRARAAQALGLVAVERPDEVATPDVLADLKIGLSTDRPAVREELAGALERVALGDPGRLRHHVADLADHLDAESERVRYHLTTALTLVGCERPARLDAAREALLDRLDDDSPHVRGRAAEALGLHARDATAALPIDRLATLADSGEPFLAERARFALDAARDAPAEQRDGDAVGTVEAVAETTAAAVEAMTAPAGDAGCPHCGLELPADGPPICPGCGAPR